MEQKTVIAYSNATISTLKTEIAHQLTLLKAIRGALPNKLAAQVQHCIMKNHELVIFTNSGAWASQLRFYQDAMISAIKSKHLNGKIKLQIKVLNSGHPSTNGAKAPFRLPSKSAIDSIFEHTQSIEQKEIRAALIKLSATLSRLHSR
jgi:hypothetical protein